MALSKNSKILIFIIIIAVLIIGAIGYLFFFKNKKKLDVSKQEVVEKSQKKQVFSDKNAENSKDKKNKKAEEKPPVTPEEENINRLAIFFAERWGSFSNQADFANIEELYPFMTPLFKETMQEFINKKRLSNKENKAEEYYGVDTKVVSLSINKITDNSAEVVVKTIRKESRKTRENTTNKIQELQLTVIKIQGSWKVDDANWL